MCRDRTPPDTRLDRLLVLFRRGCFDWESFIERAETMDRETSFRIAVVAGTIEGRYSRLLEIVQDARWRELEAADGSWLAAALAKPVSEQQMLTTGDDPSLDRLLLALSAGPDPFAIHPDPHVPLPGPDDVEDWPLITPGP